MRVVDNRHNVPCFYADGPRHTLVPVICYGCMNFMPGEPSTWIGPAEYPECSVLLFFPTRKGTCARRKPYVNGVWSTYGNKGISTTFYTALHTNTYTKREL